MLTLKELDKKTTKQLNQMLVDISAKTAELNVKHKVELQPLYNDAEILRIAYSRKTGKYYYS